MQTYSIKSKKAKAIDKIMSDASKGSEHLQKMFTDLFTNKKAVHIESSEIVGNSIMVEYCPEYTLDSGNPDWQDVVIPKAKLVQYILDNGHNQWERHFMKGGDIESETIIQDAETCLLEMDTTDRNYIIREFIENNQPLTA